MSFGTSTGTDQRDLPFGDHGARPRREWPGLAGAVLAQWNANGQLASAGRGLMLRSGSLGVRVLPSHSDEPCHIDLEIVLNVDRSEAPTVVDCTLGIAADPVEATRQAIQA